jgi:hypothetical protein
VGPPTHLGLWSGEEGRKEASKEGRKEGMFNSLCFDIKRQTQNSHKLSKAAAAATQTN